MKRLGSLAQTLSTLLLCLPWLPSSVHGQDRAWAFQSPQPPVVPNPSAKQLVRNPIDAFLLARLEANRLSFAPETDRRTLLRRVTFDLTGLPPTAANLEAFLKDTRPDAYDRLVDRLLSSPQYGERWATPWLDLVRFAETDGFKSDDLRPAAWRYRDYVIQALNSDKPYDRFLQEQIAGDELFPHDPAALVATGFQRHFPDEYNAVNLEQRRQEILNDITDTTAQVVLGLTLGCARCHDHKFDPISQEDYYRFQAFFAAYLPAEVPVGRREEVDRYLAERRAWEDQTAEVRRRLSEVEEPFRKSMMAKRKSRFPQEYQEMFELPAEKRTPLQQQIALMVGKQVNVASEEIGKSMKGEAKQRWDELRKQMGAVATPKAPAPPTAMAMMDLGSVAPPTYLLKRGDWRQHGREVEPGFPSALDERTPAITPQARSTGRRSELARWLTAPENPMTARVLVNRLWQHHFGAGIVATSSDFGAQGDLPTHPELLNWLGKTFVERGWSIKEMHRLMVTSTAYRQTSSATPETLRHDPENQLLSRMNRRRLEGEALRDALLSVAGRLNPRATGPSVAPELPSELMVGRGGWPTTSNPVERDRRSIYVFAKRNMRYPLFSTFDAPDPNETCARRFVTTTAPQALMLLNGSTVLDLAQSFASRVRAEAGQDHKQVIEVAHHLALGRAPDREESVALETFLAREISLHREAKPGSTEQTAFQAAVVDLCHALLNVNEFLYVD